MDILASKYAIGSLFIQRYCNGLYNSSLMGHYLWLQILKMLSFASFIRYQICNFFLSTLHYLPRFQHKCCSDNFLAQVMFRYYINNTLQKFQLFCLWLHINFCDIVIAVDLRLYSPKICILKPNLQCEGNWRQSLWEVIRS